MMNEQERFLKLFDALEIPREAYWRWQFKRAGAPAHVVETILEGARKARSKSLEFLENPSEEDARNNPPNCSDASSNIT
jgi:hypothetical protein